MSKQKYVKLKKTDNGYITGEELFDFEVPFDWRLNSEDLYLPIPNQDLYDTGIGTDKQIESNQIAYLEQHCFLDLRAKQGYKIEKITNNKYMFISPQNYIEIYSFLNGIVTESSIALTSDIQKIIVNNYINRTS